MTQRLSPALRTEGGHQPGSARGLSRPHKARKQMSPGASGEAPRPASSLTVAQGGECGLDLHSGKQ